MTIKDWNPEPMIGYKPQTTFYMDFGIAEQYGTDAVLETYKRVFAWWSKNAPIINEAFEQVGKPRNVVMVESSEKLNVQKEISANFDKVFTVYDLEHIVGQKVNINCGARSCNTCRRCYSKRTGMIVNEKLKGAKAA